MKLKCLDTNILLLSAQNLLTLAADGSTIVLPETVVDEMDSKKSLIGELGYQSREFGRLLARATRLDVPKAVGAVQITALELDGVSIYIASTPSYPDYSDDAPNIRNDRKIIHIAELLNHLADITFVSNDTMCLIRAESLGLTATDVKDVESTSFEFTKSLEVPPEVFSTVKDKHILDIDPDYTYENYNYKFTCEQIGQVKLATISNGLVKVIGKETEKDLRAQDVSPINSGQLLMSAGILNPANDIIVVEALAGSGKTVTAISNAIKLVKTNTPYESILYIRASVDDQDKVEEVGFLPGLEEKFAPYLHPFNDSLDFIARSKRRASKLKGEELELQIEEDIAILKAKFNMQAMTTLGMRGRTFSNCVVIIDEAQNMSKSSLQKVMTRFGKNTKVIIVGSNRQIDNPFITKYTNGLSVIMEACTATSNLVQTYAVSLDKVVRSNIAEWSERLFTKEIL